MGAMRNGYTILFGKPEGKIPHGRSRRGCEDNIKMNRREIVLWIGFIWLRIGTAGGLI
jgi:hypothetical protein